MLLPNDFVKSEPQLKLIAIVDLDIVIVVVLLAESILRFAEIQVSGTEVDYQSEIAG
jgi:hypothetical protein